MNERYSGFIGFVFYSIIGAIIFLLVYSFFFYPEIISEGYEVTKNKIIDEGNTIGNIDLDSKDKKSAGQSNIDNCRSEFDKYSKIGEDKYGIDYEINTVEIIENSQQAEEFNNLYSGFFSGLIDIENINVYPIVAIASSSTNHLDETFPIISFCDHNGVMDEVSMKRLIL